MNISSLPDERIKVLKKVLDGDLPPTAMTLGELLFIERVVYELLEEKNITEAMEQGKIVFSGVVDGLLN